MSVPMPAHQIAHRDSFEQLIRVHNRMLFQAARAILRDDAGFRGEAKLSWLVRIVVNEALARRGGRAGTGPLHA